MTWLRDFKGRAFEEGLNWNQDGKSFSTYESTAIDNSIDSDEPVWVIEQAKARKRREMLRQREDMEARLARIRTKEKAQRDKYLKGDQGFKRRKVDSEKSNEDDEEQFVLEDYDSDQEQNDSKGGKSDGVFSAATLELMAKIGMGPLTAAEEEDEAEDEIKVTGHISVLKRAQLTYLRSSTAHEHTLNSLNSSTSSDESTFRPQSRTQISKTLTSKT